MTSNNDNGSTVSSEGSEKSIVDIADSDSPM